MVRGFSIARIPHFIAAGAPPAQAGAVRVATIPLMTSGRHSKEIIP